MRRKFQDIFFDFAFSCNLAVHQDRANCHSSPRHGFLPMCVKMLPVCWIFVRERRYMTHLQDLFLAERSLNEWDTRQVRKA